MIFHSMQIFQQLFSIFFFIFLPVTVYTKKRAPYCRHALQLKIPDEVSFNYKPTNYNIMCKTNGTAKVGCLWLL